MERYYIPFIPYIVFYLAYIPKGRIRKFNTIGDYSYGIYIYAFPVQQSIIALFPYVKVYQMVILSLIVTLFLAYLSWQLVEEKAVDLKKLIFKI